MPVLSSLVNLLKKNKIKYEVIEHRKVFTAFDLAQTLHLETKEIGKDLVMKVDGNYVLVLIPASKNLDLARFRKQVNLQRKKEGKKTVKKISFASESWMKKNLKGKVGANPPFGTLQKLPVFMDRALTKVRKLVLNGGDYTFSISLSPKQYLKLEKPILGSFSKKR